MKRCSTCKKTKPFSAFCSNVNNSDKKSGYCRDCAKEQKLQKRYGIGVFDRAKMFVFQIGRCAICGLPQQEQIKCLEVDHDHKTGKVRGLLCEKCNKVLGLMDDNIGLFYKAASYLEGLRVS